MVRFGLLMANQHPPADPPLQRFAETVTQVGLARDLGFGRGDGARVERHLADERRSPAPPRPDHAEATG
jgi:hypothetical protein